MGEEVGRERFGISRHNQSFFLSFSRDCSEMLISIYYEPEPVLNSSHVCDVVLPATL